MDDLVAFTKSEEYYARIGKAWKRGYLLYGPPGTGKTTMIAAIANFLNYDIYDLELTAVKNNTDLRKLLIEISSKAIVVIEDIDCSLDITEDDEEPESEDESSSKVTLSGLLNIIDGIWSASGGERIIIFTTNHVEKLDEALIRRGRMDKHIELSYCWFEGFKVLAKNYLSIDSHPLFEVIQSLLEKTNISPADVAESLMQKSIDEDAETCLNQLIQDLETEKEGGRMKEAEKVKKEATDEKRYYKLTFHKQHRNLVIGPYLSHVLKEGRAIKVRNRQRKLYTNNGSHWSHVMFEHPATFDTLGMEAEKKKEILEDLITFSQAEEFYARIGRAWKRGYLLYGPPGTGKSTMIAAIANLLNYDIYDLELTAVKDNTELRKLLIETSSKSVVVIEDIDCSLDLTGQVTLSGLLNFIDGLWSACGGERLIVFTTNHVEKLDPALIRKGRMDKHIELSYCSFEAFRVLAKNYLLLHDHQLFDKIRQLLLETKMTPADVAEHLMPKTVPPNPEVCLNSLVQSLEAAQEEAREKNSEKEISAIEDTKEENKEAPAGTGRDESKYKQQ
ncbi:AAA-ATPase At3g28580 [Linum perenne]